ncbi:MucBP domain-containing protein, partial [Lacticaseibacillus sp. GG6-2]
MKAGSKHNSVRVNTDQKIHYKMFKDGKMWVFTGLMTTFFTVLPFLQGNIVSADTTANGDAATYVNKSDSGAASGASNTAVLQTKAAAKPTAEAESTPTKAQLDINGAQATRGDNGVVTVTGTTAANAEVTATTADGAAQTVVANANGQFSVTLATTGTVVLKASLTGQTGEPTAVVVPTASAATKEETPAPAAAPVATTPAAKAETTEATTTATSTPVAPKAPTAATTQKSETAATVDVNAGEATAETPAPVVDAEPVVEASVQDAISPATPTQTAAVKPAATVDPLAAPVETTDETQLTDNIITLVDPSNDELEAAKALAAEAFKKTGITQTIQAVAAGSVADSIFPSTDVTVSTASGQGENASNPLPSGDYTEAESEADTTIVVNGANNSNAKFTGSDLYAQILIPEGIDVSSTGTSDVTFNIDPYAVLASVMNSNPGVYNDATAESVKNTLTSSNDQHLDPVPTEPLEATATQSKVDGGTLITVDIANIDNLLDHLHTVFQGAVDQIVAKYQTVPLVSTIFGIGAAAKLGGWFVGWDVGGDPAKFLSEALKDGILANMIVTADATLSVEKGTNVAGVAPDAGAQPVPIKGVFTTAKTATDFGTGSGSADLYYINEGNSTPDEPDTTPTTDGFPVTYKYLDENGTEIPNSAKTAHVAKDGEIDFNPLDPPSGYTFDPAKTTLDVGSVIANEIQSSFSGAKDFDSLNSSLKNIGLTNPNQYTDYGSDELTITYKGAKVEQKKYQAWLEFVDEDGNVIQQRRSLGLQPAGQGVKTVDIDVTIDNYTLIGENPIAVHYVFTDVPDQTVTLTYKKNDAGGTGTPDQTTTGTVKVKLVDTDGKVVTNDAGQSELSYSGTIGDPIVVPDEAKKVTGRSITGGGDGTLNKIYTKNPQELKITYTPAPAPATTGTIDIYLVDKNGDPVKNKSGQSKIPFSGKIGTQIDTKGIDKEVDGYHIAAGDDGTAKTLTITADPQVVKIIYTKTPATTGMITVKLVDKNGDPVKNKSGQSSYEIPGEIGSQANTTVVDKEVDGYHIAAGDDGTAKPLTITAGAQTVKITYTKDGARVYTPDDPGTFKGGDPTQVYQRYLIGRLTNRVVYKGDIAELPEQHDFDDESVTVYRTATVAEDGSIVYTPWTTDPSGLGGSDDTTLLAGIPDDATHVPVVAGAKATIDAETNQAISSDDLPLVTKTKGNIDATSGSTIGSKAYNQFTVTRTVNYTSDEPKPEWHDAPSDKTDDHYAETHKTLNIKIVANKDSQTTTQATQHVTFTRKYQIDANHPDQGVIDYGEWIADSDTNGGFMYDDTDVLKASYTPTPFDHYTVTPTTVDKSTLDDQQKTVGDEITATAADTKDADNEITVTVNYEPTAVDRIEHPAPPEEDNAHYNETHKQLTVTVQAVQPDGTTKNIGTQTLDFTRTYFTDGNATGDDADKTIDLGTWKQAEPFASVTPDAIDGFTADPAEVTDAAVDTKGDTIKQAATDFAAQKDDEDGSITVNVTYSKVVEGTGTVHYVYQNVGGIELQPPVTVSGPEGTDYSTQYKIPDKLNNDGKDLPDAGGTLDTSILYYYATADINGGQINSLPDNGSADSAFKTDGQDIWVIYVAKPKASAADTVTAEEIEGDAEHPNGGTRITVKHVDGSPDTVTTVWNGNDGATPVISPTGKDNGDGTTTYDVTVNGNSAGTITIPNGKDGADAKTPLVRDGKDGQIEFYLPGTKDDGSDDTVLGSIEPPKDGDTITATPVAGDDTHPNGGTKITVKHGDGSDDTVTTVWNGNDGATPVISPTGKDNGDGTTTYDVTVNGNSAGTITIPNGKDGADAKTPLVRDGKDGQIEFYLPGTKDDGSDDTVLGSIEPPKDGDTITATPVAGDDTHPNGGTKITVKHGDGSDDTVTTVWNGDDGTDGASAFDIWKAADPDRKDATEGDFLASLQGDDGKSAYELWEAQDGNDGKSEADFLNSLKGTNGTNGKSAFEIWSTLPGNENKTEAQFIESLKGATGAKGADGTDGVSAFDIWKVADPDRKDATEGDFLASLQGDDGKSAYELWEAQDGNDGKSEADFLNSLKGTNGTNGKSAFEIWSTLPGNENKTEAQFIESLKGATGAKGADGASAFDIWKAANPDRKDATEGDFLASLQGDDGKSAYELWEAQDGNDGKSEADFLNSLKGTNGTNGKSAFEIWSTLPGNENKTEAQFIESLKGATGAKGADGASAFDIWKAANPDRKDATEGDFLASLQGDDGKSAYELWEAQDGNDGKSEADFLNSLKGTNGTNGKSAFEIWSTLPGNENKTEAQFIESLKGATGAKGADGTNGTDGASAFDIWKAADPDRKDATEGDFLASLQGGDGKSAYEVWEAQDGNDGKSEADFLNSLKGTNGTNGKSAFEIWSTLPGNENKTEAEFIESLKGAKGADGTNGASAYDAWKKTPEAVDLNGDGDVDEKDFVISIKGDTGDDGYSAWLKIPATEDINGDGSIDDKDKDLNKDGSVDGNDFIQAIKGDTGDSGYSAWLKTPATEDLNNDGSIDDKDKDLTGDGKVDENDFIKDIKGADGASAYEVWKNGKDAKDLNNDNTIDEADYAIAIKGDTGDDGYSAWLKI